MLYAINNIDTHWGDWSDILWSGFLNFDFETKQYYIERSGPFTPSIYQSVFDLVFTDIAINSYKTHKIKGLSFEGPLEKRKIVNIDWMSWDKNKDYYEYMENVFEPEDVIDIYPHDSALALTMPNYWKAIFNHKIHINVNKAMRNSRNYEEITIPKQELADSDFFCGIETLHIFLSENAKAWIEKNFPDCFNFYPILSA